MFRPEIESGDFVGNADIITKLPLLRWVITSDVASKHYPLVRRVDRKRHNKVLRVALRLFFLLRLSF